MELTFSKMQGLGNDFVVIDAINRSVSLTKAQVRQLANRRFGVGCDQVLLAEPPPRPDVDFGFRIFNQDGTQAEQCGNGVRCLARFLNRQGLTDKSELRIAAPAGTTTLYLESDGTVTVDMGRPRLEPEEIPFAAEARQPCYDLEVDGQIYEVGAVSLGNPHVVLRVPSAADAAVLELGPRIEGHHRFPRRVNVGFMEVVDRQHIRLRAFERGAGETAACGSGACAAVVTGRLRKLLDQRVIVSQPGGDLVVSWAMGDEPVTMRGPAIHIFEGRINL